MLKTINALRERLFSTGALIVVTIAVATTILMVLLPAREPAGIQFWVVSTHQYGSYIDRVVEWNREHPDKVFAIAQIHDRAAERRMLSGFLSGTPMADMLESNDSVYPKAFLGPVEQIGFLDLTDRLHEEGVYQQFNEPSFSTMTSRGRIFGLPHDVHPVLLGYRSDLVEEAGIDVNEIETWEDYFRVMRPLMRTQSGDGRPDRYLLNLSELATGSIIALLLQNDGVIFDENDIPIFANTRNARTLATITTWITGPQRTTIEVSGTPSGHRQQLDGLVIGTIMPDWLMGSWKRENPKLAGKIKFIPLPAWERGGRRTSVLGGSMLGINKHSPHVDDCWEMAKYLYASPVVAERNWRLTNIISPMKALWDEPFYHEADPFWGGQPVGTLLIEQAPNVPRRPSSPYTGTAYGRIGSVVIALRAYAERHKIYDVEDLTHEALRLLQHEETALKRLISRNVFHE